MNATSIALSPTLSCATEMPPHRLWRAYWKEAKYETLRALRAPAFAIPFLLLPIALYVLIGVLLIGSMSHGDLRVSATMFVNFAVFGIIGPGMFGFGMFVATEREQGLLRLKRALPMPTSSYVLAKMAMTMMFAAIVMFTLIVAALTVGHLRLSVGQCLLIVLADILGSLPFCAVGLFVGTRASAKSAPAFVNLAYLPIIHLGGLLYPLPKSVQPLESASPAFYLAKIGLRILRTPNLDEMTFGAGPSSRIGAGACIALLAGLTLLLGWLATRRLQRLG